MTENLTKTFTFYVCALCFCNISHTYNIDTRNAIIFTGPEGSYFGYSVGILENNHGIQVLVGAPRDNNTALPNLIRPGQLYKCSYRSKHCQPVTVSNVGNTEETVTYHGKKVTYQNDMNNQWLGMSLDIEPNNHSSVTVCAPRWKDSYMEKKMRGISHMNGICYLLDPDLTSPPTPLPALTNLRRLVNRKSHYVEFSMGSMGFSTVYSKEHNTILFGAPGLNDWSGGVAIETVTGNNTIKYIEPPRQEYQDSYSGSAITTGRFINRNKYSIAIGAPRAKNTGQVLLYSSKSTTGPVLSIKGIQIGSYFGASLCSLNIKNNLLDDLVVGAPMFAGKGPEEGRVFVYKSHGLLGFRKKATVLKGKQKKYGRFGTAVANIGDIDKDGFEDIVVGAPYEDDGQGSVYVYNGYVKGIWHHFTQRITAKDMPVRLLGFGISFSRPFDVDKNTYSDFAAGAYRSSNVVLLRSQPLVDMSKTSLRVANLSSVNGCISRRQYNENCTNYNLVSGNVVLCLSYIGQRVNSPSSIALRYSLIFDSSRNISRLFHKKMKTMLSNGRTVNGKRKVQINRKACQNIPFFIQYTDDTNEDLLINLEYNIEGRLAKLKQFDGTKVQPVIPNKLRTKIDLQPKCTDEDNCDNDILINVLMTVPGESRTIYVIGRSQKVHMKVNLQNIKTTRDITVKINYSKTLSFIKGVRFGDSGRLQCDVYGQSGVNLTVVCKLYNDGLRQNNSDNVSALFEFYLEKEDVGKAKFEINVYSLQRTSNTVTLELPIVKVVKTVVLGKATPDEVIFRRENGTGSLEQQITFTYVILNRGPSLLENSSIFISYPEIPGVLDMNGLNIVTNPKDSSRYNCILKGKGYASIDLVRTIDEDRDINLICDGGHFYCTNIVCKLEKIYSGAFISLHINMLITINGNKFQKLRHVRLVSTAYLKNTSQEEDWDELLLFRNWNEKSQVMLDIFNINTDYNVREIQIWIVVVSAAGGMAFFLIISVFMFKVGFFRRLENEDLLLRKANWKLQIADARRYENGSVGSSQYRHNMSYDDDIDDDETGVLFPYSNDSPTSSFEEGISSISFEDSGVSFEDSGYLEPVKTRKQRVFLK